MQKNLPSAEKKSLRLNKTSIAHLTLTNRQMRQIKGGVQGAFGEETDPTLSQAINNPNPCTTIPLTMCSIGLTTK